MLKGNYNTSTFNRNYSSTSGAGPVYIDYLEKFRNWEHQPQVHPWLRDGGAVQEPVKGGAKDCQGRVKGYSRNSGNVGGEEIRTD